MSEQDKPSQRALRHRAELLAQLAELEPFLELERETQRKVERMKAVQLSAWWEGGQPVDQRQVDYDRGVTDGMAYVFQVVRGAAKKLRELDASEASESEPDDEGKVEW